MDIQILRDVALDWYFDGKPVEGKFIDLGFIAFAKAKAMSPEKRLAIRLLEVSEVFRLAERERDEPWGDGEREKWIALIGEAAKALADAMPEGQARMIRRALDDGPWAVERHQPAPQPQDEGAEGGEGVPGGAGAAMTEPERRLVRLRGDEVAGKAKYKNGSWSFIGSTILARLERSEGRARSDEKTVRADLKEAAQAEREAKAAGFGAGFGQR